MENFDSILCKALSVCNGNFTYCTEFFRIYTFTTENIAEYLQYFDLNNKSLLTVGSSGDQILNAYFYGARDITLYDINQYAQYYVYLKIAAILCLNYKEFQEFFFKDGLVEYYNKKMFAKEMFNKIKDTLRLLDYESFLFFDELFCLYDVKKIRGYLFNDDESRNKVIINFNAYLKNEETYNRLKSIIKAINFKYINGDILNDNINGMFDNIILSNICTTTSVERLKQLLEKLDNNNLKEKGSILLGYLWDTDFETDDFQDDWQEIYKLPITREVLKQYITETYNINGDRDFIWNRNEKRDLVLIYRKK